MKIRMCCLLLLRLHINFNPFNFHSSFCVLVFFFVCCLLLLSSSMLIHFNYFISFVMPALVYSNKIVNVASVPSVG